ncbi:hypothetical protein GLOIN_2v1778520 [Rhizophagus clarus]|uniref:Uncharacterized protein n=1 Tax=Rhizophagus clarus TaxID=94130 RepID=A0A8H3LLD9_9GLOM|nr:hypothetical protein GLOIN_2v1778520 [Rhizophagus clarus]
MSNKEKPYMVIPTPIPELESEKEALVLGVDYITKEEAKNWISPNARKPREQIKTWGRRLQKRWKELDLGVEPIEANDLDELEKYEGSPGPKTQSFREGNKSKNLINKEFERLGEIKGYKNSEKDLEFREQEELGTAVKRRAVAVHHAKVPKSHPDNGSDIRKI